MKKKTFFSIFLLVHFCNCFCQINTNARFLSEILEVTYNKTTVLLFPGNIRKVDIGSDDITAKTVRIGENERILRVKANKDTEFSSSLHVFTDDGRVFSFDVKYSSNPPYQIRDLGNESAIASINTEVVPAHMLASQIRECSATIGSLKPITKRPKMNTGGMVVHNSGTYIFNGILFFQFEIGNSSGIPYDLDFCRFSIRDINSSKRSTAMEKEINPLYVLRPHTASIDKGQHQVLVAAFDKFTISERKLFVAEFYEKNGDRHLKLCLKGKHLLKARPLLPLSLSNR